MNNLKDYLDRLPISPLALALALLFHFTIISLPYQADIKGNLIWIIVL